MGYLGQKRLWILFLAVMPVFRLSARIAFTGLDLSEDNRMIFRAYSAGDGALDQEALFISHLTDLSLTQISAFAEKMELIEDGRTLQLGNAFGAQRIPLAGGIPRSIPGLRAFMDGIPALGGRVESLASSADGKWLLQVEPVSAGFGNLVLIDTLTGSRSQIASGVERPDLSFPACWSPDSRVFIYNRAGRLYYHTISSSATPVDERYRLIGEGTINSVAWGKAGDFFYLRGSTVYRVRGSDLFARTIYADFLDIGAAVGNIPFEFDYNFDVFWIAPDSRSILLAKGGRNVFYYPLGLDDYAGDIPASLPYIMLPRSGLILSVLWSPQGVITVLASAREQGEVLCYRLTPGDTQEGLVFRPLRVPPLAGAALSPDGTRVLFWGEEGLILYDYLSWRALLTLSGGPVQSCLWTGSDSLVVGDGFRIEHLKLEGASITTRTLVCISSAAEFGFEDRGGRIFAQNNGQWFATDGNSPWTPVWDPVLRPLSLVSGRYRVYPEKQNTGPYDNLPMIRNTASVGTIPLIPPVVYLDSPSPVVPEDPPTAGLFTHARRDGPRQVALCFDCYDDAAGLPWVLDALRRFGFKATFFLNGEFIRRHPGAILDIVEAGHETASMFFAPIDLSDPRYRIQGDFISRGLARNEDEFFRVTESELELLWHTPFYTVSPDLITVAAASGYLTIGRDVDPLDWVGRADSERLSLPRYSASEMVDRIMDRKRPGSVIPIRLGLLPGGRDDYLFSRINVLLDALVRSGYSVVPLGAFLGLDR
ncbi:MAG: polysaccharide deacetylase family protein [Spirochaetaceae bacterium]|nr:polysaccharide deacetylase family protein [Spirochaetaceae bacterium]